jgi:hypothetical protein
MYKTRLSSWGLCKNVRKKDWQDFAIMRQQREATGKPFDRVEIHRKMKSEKNFRDYLKHQNVSEEEFVREAIASSRKVPSHILYRDSPSPVVAAASIAESRARQGFHADKPHQVETRKETNSMYPSLLTDEAPLVPAYLPALGAVNSPGRETAGASHSMQYGASLSSSADIDQSEWNNPFNFQGDASFQGQGPCQGTTYDRNSGLQGYTTPNWPNALPLTPYTMPLPNYLSQVIEPEAGVMPVRPSYNDFGGMLGQILGPGFQETAVGDSSDGSRGYHAFMSDTIMACISAASKEFTLCAQWLEKASLELVHMCNSPERLHLAMLSTVLVWLQVHDQGSADGSIGIAESMMRQFTRTAISVLGEDASVCLLLEWMTAVAGKKLADCRITSDMLQQVWVEYRNVLGPQHPNTIVARYCLSFHLINVNKSYAEAEDHLHWAHEAAIKVFGASQLQSINILATLSRAQSRQGNLTGALETIQRCVKEEPLGQNHPHRLMLLLRMAIIYGRLGLVEEREKLYWIVVEGRAATLGPLHESTTSAYNSLVRILQEAGKWDSAKEHVEKLLSEPHVAVSEYETWWSRMAGHGQSSRRSFSEETE